jgi:hypothetical protein
LGWAGRVASGAAAEISAADQADCLVPRSAMAVRVALEVRADPVVPAVEADAADRVVAAVGAAVDLVAVASAVVAADAAVVDEAVLAAAGRPQMAGLSSAIA